MLSKRSFLGMLLGVSISSGCVPKGRYDDALLDADTLRGRVADLEGSLDAAGTERAKLETELMASARALEETNRKLAAKIAEAGALADDIEVMKTALSEAEVRKAKADAALRDFQELVERFRSMIDAGTLSVKVLNGRMVVELATDILFPPGDATLSRKGREAIEGVAGVLAEIEERTYQVVGHTDSVPIATERFPSNWYLGAGRAISVVNVLVGAGLDPARVSVASAAEFQPIDTNRTPDGRAANRRIEIVIVPDLSALPGYDELQALTPSDGGEGVTEP